MELYKETRIRGSFRGWRSHAVFELANGQTWEQAEYRYQYRYAYSPQAKIFRDGSRYYLHVDGMSDMVRIKKA